MISVCGDIIRNRLLDKIHKANFFSVIADETTDSSNVEQLFINVRFLENGEPHRKFLDFQEASVALLVRQLLIIFYQSLLTGS